MDWSGYALSVLHVLMGPCESCICTCYPGGEEVYGGLGFRGGTGGGQRDEGREPRDTETKTLQQEGQRSATCLSANTKAFT